MKFALKVILSAAVLTNLATAKGFHGFYFGGAGGINQTLINATLSNAQPDPLVLKTLGRRNMANFQAFFGGGKRLSNGIIPGFEFFMDINPNLNKDFTSASQSFASEYRKKGIGYGVTLRVGGEITKGTLLFVGAGAKVLKIQYDSIDIGPAPGRTQTHNKIARRTIPLIIQAGVEGLFADNIDYTWRTVYSYTRGKTFMFTNLSGTNLGQPGAFAEYKSTEHIVFFGIAYRL